MKKHIDIDAIKSREQAATPGPWEYIAGEDEQLNAYPPDEATGFVREMPVIAVGVETREETGADEDFHFIEISEDDAEFITNARQDIPALLAEVERLQGLVAALKGVSDGES